MNEENDFRSLVFRHRSYTPLPFLVVMVVFARPVPWSIVAGILIMTIGEALRFWGVSIVGAETRTTGRVGGTHLITSGPFAYIRNPLYLGNMMLYAGVGIMSMALFPWLLAAAVLWFYIQYWLIVTREEEYLASTFGDAFGEYVKNVPRFFPRLTPYRSTLSQPKRTNLREGLASERRTLQAIGLVMTALLVVFAVRTWGS
jgi:protein-S-isoprenylcysteine O-methyltransferase Ste14